MVTREFPVSVLVEEAGEVAVVVAGVFLVLHFYQVKDLFLD